MAGNTWDGGGSDNNWGTGANWNADGAPSYGTITFAGAVRTSNTNNSITSMNQMQFTGTSNWNIGSNGTVLSLFDFGGGQAKIEQQGTGSVTLSLPITFAANNGAPPNPFGEINAVAGDITFSGATLTVNGSSVNGIKYWGGNGKAVNFANTVSSSGKWMGFTGTNGTIVNINTGANVTIGDFYVMNGNTLNLNGGTLTTTAIRLGGDFGNTGNQNQTLGGTLALAPLTGGISFSGVINSVSGNSSGNLLISSLNTSGTNTLGSGIFLDSALKIQTAAGGVLNMTGGSVDVKAQQLTFTGSGLTLVPQAVSSSLAAGGSLVKQGSGTVILQGTSNNYTGTSNSTLNAQGTQINGGILGIHGDGSLGLAPAGTYNNIQFTGNATLQDTANNITLATTRGISIAPSVTGTLDNGGNSFTVQGLISGSGNLATKGSGTVTLTGSSSFTGSTTVAEGSLNVSGNIASSSGVSVSLGASLRGVGRVSAVSGGGTVSPGNATGTLTGILTAPQVNPIGGLRFNFELSGTGSPVYSNAASSGNDVLRLTSGTPFASGFGFSNVVTVDLGGTLAIGQTYLGGFFTDTNTNFLSSLQGGQFNFTNNGGALPEGLFVDVSVATGQFANFSSGSVTGAVTQFMIIPEPSTIGLVLSSLLGGATVLGRRRRS